MPPQYASLLSLVDQVLLRHSDHAPYVRMICFPSFNREWAVMVEAPKGDSSRVQYVIVKRPIWMDPRPTEIETDEAVAQISKTTAEKIRQAWIAMLGNPRNMEPRRLGLDGVIYRFTAFTRDYGELTDETWTPDPVDPPGLLAELGEMLREFTQAEAKDRPEFEAAIRQKAEHLLGQISVLEWQKRLRY